MPWIEPGRDPWGIPNPDTSRHYRWVSNKPERLMLWLKSYGSTPGYTLEQKATLDKTREHAIALGLPPEYVNENTNRIEYGLNTLASIPMEERDRRIKLKLDELIERRQASVDEFHAKGDELPGVRTFEEHPEQTQDRKKFATRTERPFSGQSGVGTSPNLR